ncbi:MAG: cobalamin B12-binding domain-containing protein [Candidatus Kapaibacterium sp.]
MKKQLILGGALGNCVHVGGLHHFLKLAEPEGYETVSLGPAVNVELFIREIIKHKPDIAAVSFRLTPEVGEELFRKLKDEAKKNNLSDVRFIFGGTPPVAEKAKESGLFEKVFNGTETMQEIVEFLRGYGQKEIREIFPDNLVDRINKKFPYPLLRHHFGRPTMEETLEGVKKIAESGVLDILSIGTDQNAQEHFFNPENMKKSLDGAGGVPVRKAKDLSDIYVATRCGNYPLVRCYSGTNNLLKWAQMSVETINNAWAAIPLTWYSVMDGRSNRSLKKAIAENQSVMKWYADKGIPVEVNESHQWSLRDAHDSLAVTMSFLAAYNARKMGVKNYVSQYMFNTPPGTTPQMDIAKMMAKNEMINTLKNENFEVFREVRAGIAHFSGDAHKAKGQAAASAVISLTLKPHIVHVVGFSEGDHATHPEELIESCKIIHGVLFDCLDGMIDASQDLKIDARKKHLMNEANDLLEAIKVFGADRSDDPWSSPDVLADAIKEGILDAPHFRGNEHLYGKIYTKLIGGSWNAFSEDTGEEIPEKDRCKEIPVKNK